jgi:hypothetical protein
MLADAVAAVGSASTAASRAEAARSASEVIQSAILAVAGEDAGINDSLLGVPQNYRLGTAANADAASLTGIFETTYGAAATLGAWPIRRAIRATAAVTLTLPPLASTPLGWNRLLSIRGGSIALAPQGVDLLNGSNATLLVSTTGRTLIRAESGYEVY